MTHRYRRWLWLCLLAHAFLPGPSAAQPPAGRPETAAARASLPTELLTPIFARYIKPSGVDYAGLKADAQARAALSRYLDAAADMPEQAPLSDWLNLYNALVIQQVIERYPLASVMDVQGFFKGIRHPIAGKPRTLDELEHQLIRARFKDARVHMALNCGARSCPRLAREPFAPGDLDGRLEALAAAMLADRSHVRADGDKLYLSAIFFWFERDFKREAGDVRSWIARHAPPGTLAGLVPNAGLVQLDYDWTLNAAR